MNYNYNYETVAGATAGVAAVVVIIAIIAILISLAVGIVLVIGHWKLYKKAGKQGWEAIVPIYNNIVLGEIAGLNWYWVLAMYASAIVSIMGSVVGIFNLLALPAAAVTIAANVGVAFNLQKKLHKENDTAWLVLTCIFTSLMLAIAGYSKKESYDASVEVDPDSYLKNMLHK